MVISGHTKLLLNKILELSSCVSWITQTHCVNSHPHRRGRGRWSSGRYSLEMEEDNSLIECGFLESSSGSDDGWSEASGSEEQEEFVALKSFSKKRRKKQNWMLLKAVDVVVTEVLYTAKENVDVCK